MEGVALNLFPFYEILVRQKTKTTSIRLGDKRDLYKVGDNVNLTVGWKPEEAPVRAKVRITKVEYCEISRIPRQMLLGESPDCQDVKNVPYMLSAIYRRRVIIYDFVTIISWEYLDTSADKMVIKVK